MNHFTEAPYENVIIDLFQLLGCIYVCESEAI